MNGQILSGTCIAVDFWNIKGRQENFVHFLTHVHGDHVIGLTSSWKSPLYCSAFTAQFLEGHYNIARHLLKVLPLNQCTLVQIPNSTESFCVTAFEANHCPGALMLYFEGKFGNFMHTGDFRFSDEMAESLAHLHGKIDRLYFDNTFCSIDCVFPSRDECLQMIIDIAKKHSDSDIVIGMRKLGKESMLAKLGVALNETIFISPERFKIAHCLFDCNVFSIHQKDEKPRIRTLPFLSVSRGKLYELNKTTPTIAILPTAIFTGLSCKPFCRDPHIYVVPYSDHSSFPELVRFVRDLQPKELIPIVTGSRGPFGTDISDRADMSLFKSYLKMDAISRKSMDINPHDISISSISQGYDTMAGILSCEKELCRDKLSKNVSCNSSATDESTTGDPKHFSMRDSILNSFENQERSVSSMMKRKHSFQEKRKRKIAKGVIFEEEHFAMASPTHLSENDNDANANLKNIDTGNISSGHLSFQPHLQEHNVDECEELIISDEDLPADKILIKEENCFPSSVNVNSNIISSDFQPDNVEISTECVANVSNKYKDVSLSPSSPSDSELILPKNSINMLHSDQGEMGTLNSNLLEKLSSGDCKEDNSSEICNGSKVLSPSAVGTSGVHLDVSDSKHEKERRQSICDRGKRMKWLIKHNFHKNSNLRTENEKEYNGDKTVVVEKLKESKFFQSLKNSVNVDQFYGMVRKLM